MYTSRSHTALYGVIVKMVLCALCIFSAFNYSRAQEPIMRVYFPYDDATLMENYMSNAGVFAQMDEILSSGAVPQLEIISYSSPEGNWNYNLRLSRRRANALKSYLEATYPQLAGLISINPDAESWDELRNLVSSDSRLSDETRQAVIDIIDSDNAPDVKEKALKAMDGYRKFYRNFFRNLRYAQIYVTAESAKVAASGTDGEGSADGNVAAEPSTTVIRGNSEHAENTVYNSETASLASNDSAAVSGSAATASVSSSATGQSAASVAGVPVVYFLYSEDTIRPDYMNNQANLKEIARMIASGEITDFTLAGFSSPEGSVRSNESLSFRRAMALKKYLEAEFPELEGKINIVNGGENWTALRELVANGSALSESEKAQVLSILDSDDDAQTKEARLKRTSAYRTMARRYFPKIRCASFATTEGFDGTQGNTGNIDDNGIDDNGNTGAVTEPVDTTATVTEPVDTTATTQPADTTATVQPVDTTATVTEPVDTTATTQPADTAAVRDIEKPIIAVSTNMAFDIIAAPNFAIEVPIGQKWSVYGEYTFPWWLARGNEWCYEMLKWDIGARYRLGNKFDRNDPLDVLSGHFVGLDLSAGYYDFEPMHKGYQGEFQAVSLEYGYAWKLGKHWRLDAYADLGWMGTHYRYYEADKTDQHLIYQHSGKLNWFGPTKAGVSIKYIFTHKQKGAAR